MDMNTQTAVEEEQKYREEQERAMANSKIYR